MAVNNIKKMPATRTIGEIKLLPDGEETILSALISKFEQRETNNEKKSPFLYLEVRDRTGQIPCYVWNQELIKEILNSEYKEQDVVAIVAKKKSYQGKEQIEIQRIKPYKGQVIDYVQSTQYDVEGMYKYVYQYANSLREPLRSILVNKLDNNKETFISAPAAKFHHDNFGGGLLEHTWKELQSYNGQKHLYPNTDSDVMVFSIIYHDFEKINGYSLLPNINVTKQEILLGHSVAGTIKLSEELKPYLIDGTIDVYLFRTASYYSFTSRST